MNVLKWRLRAIPVVPALIEGPHFEIQHPPWADQKKNKKKKNNFVARSNDVADFEIFFESGRTRTGQFTFLKIQQGQSPTPTFSLSAHSSNNTTTTDKNDENVSEHELSKRPGPFAGRAQGHGRGQAKAAQALKQVQDTASVNVKEGSVNVQAIFVGTLPQRAKAAAAAGQGGGSGSGKAPPVTMQAIAFVSQLTKQVAEGAEYRVESRK